ncbi:hypothetical protein D1159_02665 [Pseudoflavonifractor sp. 524-17]|uniref:hypothetical protein n=1 Tax=Pseudoflavonifractor sp. 524-17 TaxID=2304577 RepID=UPI001379D157|nr:hypothetical protein [Pseudoflavonifractor sp. 524-17]NCE63510.1 hypothetical protein [Pseudoflavonifractor sp. 524-17]
MKMARFVLKIVALSLGLAAAVCCAIAYWDRLADFVGCAKEKIMEKKPCCCHSEFDDYADWDD